MASRGAGWPQTPSARRREGGAARAAGAPPPPPARPGAPCSRAPLTCTRTQGLYKYHQYQVVGRHNPTASEPNPTVFRMKVWAPDAVCAKSKFW